jgi:hypothetical protein
MLNFFISRFPCIFPEFGLHAHEIRLASCVLAAGKHPPNARGECLLFSWMHHSCNAKFRANRTHIWRNKEPVDELCWQYASDTCAVL